MARGAHPEVTIVLFRKSLLCSLAILAVGASVAAAHDARGDNPAWWARPLAAVSAAPNEPADWVPADYDGQAFAKDQTDLTSLPKVHAVYVHASDQQSRFAALAHTFQGQARRQSRALTRISGRALRLDDRLDASGRPLLDITVIRSRSTTKALGGSRQFGLVSDDLGRAGLTDPNKKYLVWVDAPSTVCGQSTAPGDAVRSPANRAEARTVSTITRYYAPSTPDTGGFCAPILHELGHAMGAVLPSAPHHTAGHCNDNGNDYLCLSASAIPYDPAVGRYFDYGNDDYWDPAADPFSGSQAKLAWWTVNLSRFLCPPATPFDPSAPAADCAQPSRPGY